MAGQPALGDARHSPCARCSPCSLATTSSISSSSSAPPYSSQDTLPFVPTLALTSPSNYGRFNAENESNLDLLTSVPDNSSALRRRGKLPTMSFSSGSQTTTQLDRYAMTQENHRQFSSSTPPFFNIPPELVDAIFSHLSAYDLAAVSATSRVLRKHALSDLHWQRCIQENVPGLTLTSSGPCPNYRELYRAHDRLWFLPKYKIWFCDRDLTGKLIVVRYDQRRGCIEGYQMVAVSNRTTFEHWPADHEVIIHGFEPQVKLHLDKPVLQFRVQDRQEDGGFSKRPGANRFADEMPMALDERLGGMFSNFLLTRPLSPEEADRTLATEYPYENIWPPPAVPARQHVYGARSGQPALGMSYNDRPQHRSQVSDQTFRIRQWMELAGTPAPPGLMGQAGGFSGPVQVQGDGALGDVVGNGAIGVHIGEEIITYSTLDPVLYTPTPTKPWRGIWVGDYSGHGCEFLLINQPDDPPATDAELGLIRQEFETDEAWEQRRLEARIFRGRLEAIKLTGDPNVPRGEYTFIADDLGPGGYVGVATDATFSGARVVQSKGHVAATGFLRDKFIESQLILISPNRLAQYWVGFGHISFFERVDIDSLLAP